MYNGFTDLIDNVDVNAADRSKLRTALEWMLSSGSHSYTSISSIVVLEESPCPRWNNFQVVVLVLVIGAQVLVLELQVRIFGSSGKFLRIQ